MKKQLFIKKISELNSNLELSRKIRESISVPYEAPENSVLDMDIIHNATEAMKKLSDFDKDDLSDVLNILRNNDIETFGTILEKQSSDGELLFAKITKESSLKSSYYENLRRITDNTSAYHIYKNSVQNINSEILKISNVQYDFPTNSAIEMIRNLLVSNDQIISDLKETFTLANDSNEQGLANFIAERIDQHQFWSWQLSVSLKTMVA